jgi:hypothetical protein
MCGKWPRSICERWPRSNGDRESASFSASAGT